MSEEDLHEIFFKFPYLIMKEPDSILNVIHEYKLDSNSIPDIYIETIKNKYFCEVKLTKLKEKDLYQSIRYLNTVRNKIELHEDKEIFVILIGMNISNQLRKKANKENIKILIIGDNINDSIKICKKCRRAYDSTYFRCNFCDSEEILEFITLKYP